MATKSKFAASDRRAVSHQLREAIEADGRTAYALGKAAGVDAGVIQRFLNRERGVTLETVDRLALALGLRLLETGRGRGRPSKPSRPARIDRSAEGEIGPPDVADPDDDLDRPGPPQAAHEPPGEADDRPEGIRPDGREDQPGGDAELMGSVAEMTRAAWAARSGPAGSPS